MKGLLALSVASVCLAMLRPAHADTGMFNLSCDQFTYNSVKAQVVAPAPYGHPEMDWTPNDFHALVHQYRDCNEQNPIPATKVLELDQLVRERQASIDLLRREQRKAMSREDQSAAKRADIADTLQYGVQSEQYDRRKAAEEREAYLEKHDPRRLQASYFLNTSLVRYGPSTNPEDDYVTSHDQYGWIFNGNMEGEQAHCMLTIGFESLRAPPTEPVNSRLPGEPGPPAPQAVKTGALLLHWAKGSGVYTLMLARPGWHVPEKAKVQTSLDVLQPSPPSTESPSGNSSLPGAAAIQQQILGLYQQQMSEVNRQMAALGGGGGQGTHKSVDLAFFGTGSDILATQIGNPALLLTYLQNFVGLHFAQGSEPNWIPRGFAENTLIAFKACVNKASTVAKAAAPSAQTQPY